MKRDEIIRQVGTARTDLVWRKREVRMTERKERERGKARDFLERRFRIYVKKMGNNLFLSVLWHPRFCQWCTTAREGENNVPPAPPRDPPLAHHHQPTHLGLSQRPYQQSSTSAGREERRRRTLLVLSNKILHIRFRLGEFHLVHTFSSVLSIESTSASAPVDSGEAERRKTDPMQECLSLEHGRELLSDPLEQLLNRSRVSDERDRHSTITRRNITVSGLDVVGNPFYSRESHRQR